MPISVGYVIVTCSVNIVNADYRVACVGNVRVKIIRPTITVIRRNGTIAVGRIVCAERIIKSLEGQVGPWRTKIYIGYIDDKIPIFRIYAGSSTAGNWKLLKCPPVVCARRCAR